MLFKRDISWIHFNGRVLNEAVDRRTPLLERVRFLQIFTTNFDEFFMKRVGGLKRKLILASPATGSALRTEINGLLQEIREQTLPLLKEQSRCWSELILPGLEQEGISLVKWSDLSPEEMIRMESFFDQSLFPVLTPLAVGPGHPFPFLSNLSNSLGVLLSQDPGSSDILFARVKIPSTFPYWVRLNSGHASSGRGRWISVQSVISQFAWKLFPGLKIVGSSCFRITRNADVDRDEEDVEDLLEMVTEEIRERKFAEVVRLETGSSPNGDVLQLLKHELNIDDNDIYCNEADVDFSQLSSIVELSRSDLKYPVWMPVPSQAFSSTDESMFSVIREKDVLVHHPYESFGDSVEKFVRTAVEDPAVLAIKMTLYRTGVDSPFIPLLIKAAESGKQVVCLVELKARFDEEKNIQVARSLENAGVHVVYGIVGLKTHCKVTLVIRQEGERIQSYVHVATGNYHSRTAKTYTDFGLFTSDPEIADDVVHLFHFLTGRSLNRDYKKLLVAPVQMKHRFLEMIEFEAEQARKKLPARIIAKMNSLEDNDIIQALYRASQAGVEIDLIVRGFCCLVPQVKGLSENIRVISVIGRFLEHCRVFFFQNGAKSLKDGMYWIGSADWMTRNLSTRVEAVVPIEEPSLKLRLYNFLQVLLKDQRQAWDLDSTGEYRQRQPISGLSHIGAQDVQMGLYRRLPEWSRDNGVLTSQMHGWNL